MTTAVKKKKRRKQSRPKISSDEQHARFVEAARRLNADETGAEFDTALDKILKHKPKK